MGRELVEHTEVQSQVVPDFYIHTMERLKAEMSENVQPSSVCMLCGCLAVVHLERYG